MIQLSNGKSLSLQQETKPYIIVFSLGCSHHVNMMQLSNGKSLSLQQETKPYITAFSLGCSDHVAMVAHSAIVIKAA
jgi:hypothetical protein